MKIDKPTPGSTPAKTANVKTTGVQGKATGKTAGSGRAAGGGADQLTLTASSAMVRGLETELAGVDVTDTAKIEAVKAALADGSFTVNAEVVADRMIDEARQNLSRRPRSK
jgi:negative regulator of flagellin synthesis FlgM